MCTYGNSLHQPEYKLLKDTFGKGYDKSDILEVISKNLFVSSQENYINLRQFLPHMIHQTYYLIQKILIQRKKLFIFDDVMMNKNQDITRNFYSRGRHNYCSCICIAQNYHKLPRQTIKTNCNSLILFEIPIKDLKHIYDDIVSNDMCWDELNNFCKGVFRIPYSFIAITKDVDVLNGK